MLHTCAVRFTEFLNRHCDLPVDCQDIYIYGAELFLSTSLFIISMLMISLVAGKPISGILFVLIFVGLRVFVGGFHAATYGTCFLLTNGVFLTAFLSSILLEKCGSPILSLVLVFSIGVIWVLSPIKNAHHPLSEKAYKRNKKIGRAIALGVGLAETGSNLFEIDISMISIVSTSIAAVAVMMIIPKLTERRIYRV